MLLPTVPELPTISEASVGGELQEGREGEGRDGDRGRKGRGARDGRMLEGQRKGGMEGKLEWIRCVYNFNYLTGGGGI